VCVSQYTLLMVSGDWLIAVVDHTTGEVERLG